MSEELQIKIRQDEAQIGGVKIHYATAGTGDKLVVLLHGFPEFWYSWRHQIIALSEDYTVVAPDLRGFNLSDKPRDTSAYDIDKVADDVIGLIRHFGREKAAVIGHDWGASVAWNIAIKHPEVLTKVGALQVPPPSVLRKNMSLSQLLSSWYMFFFQIPKLPEWLLSRNDFEALEKGLKNSTVRKGVFTDAEIKEYKKAWREDFAITAMLNYYRANFYRRFIARSHEIPKIKVPTLFIFAEQDKAILRETVANVGEAIDAPFEEFFIPSSGHWVQQEEPETVT
ncbi:MAG: alpha/beta hydrolase, partial [Pyrinomonadaceae bacterium]